MVRKRKFLLTTLLLILVLTISTVLFACGNKSKTNNPVTPTNAEIVLLPEGSPEYQTSISNGSFYNYTKPENATTNMPYAPSNWIKNTQDGSISGVISLEKEFFEKYKNLYGNIPYPFDNDTNNTNSDKRALLIKFDKESGSNLYYLENIPVKFSNSSEYAKLEIVYKKYGFAITSSAKFTIGVLRDISLSSENKQNEDSTMWEKETFYFKKSSLLDQNILKKITITLTGKGALIIDHVNIIDSDEVSYNNASNDKKLSLDFPNSSFNPAISGEYTATNLTDTTTYQTTLKNITSEAGSLASLDTTDNSLNDYIITNKPDDINSVYAVYSSGKQNNAYKKFSVDILSKQPIFLAPNTNYTISIYTYANFDINYKVLTLLPSGMSVFSQLIQEDVNWILSASPTTPNANTWVKHTLEVKGGQYPSKADLHFSAEASSANSVQFILFGKIEIEKTGSTPATLTSDLTNTQEISDFTQKNQDSTGLNVEDAIYKNAGENSKCSIFGEELSQILLSNTTLNTNIVESANVITIAKNKYYYLDFFAKLDDHVGAKPTLTLTTKDQNIQSSAQNISFNQIDSSYSILNVNGYKHYVAYIQGSPTNDVEYKMTITFGTGSRLNNKNLSQGNLYITVPKLSEIKEIDYIKENIHLFQIQKLKSSLGRSSINTLEAIGFSSSYSDTYAAYSDLYPEFFSSNKPFAVLNGDVPFKPSGWDLTGSDLKEKYFSDNFGNYHPDVENPASLNADKWTVADELKPIYKLNAEKAPLNTLSKEAVKNKIVSISTDSTLVLQSAQNISSKENTLTLYPSSVLALSFSALTNVDGVTIKLNINNVQHSLITLTKVDFEDDTEDNLKNIKYYTYTVYIVTAPFAYNNAKIEIEMPSDPNAMALFDKNFELKSSNITSYLKAASDGILSKDYAKTTYLGGAISSLDVLAGVEKTDSTTNLSGLPGAYSDYNYNDSLLMLNVKNESKRTYSLTNANLIALNPQSYYHLRVYYRFTGTGAADITLNNSSLSEDTIFRSIQAKDSDNSWELKATTWTPIDFYFSTGFSKLSFSLSISVGKFNEKYDTTPVQGKVEVSHIVLSELTEELFNDQENDKLNFQTEDFDLTKTVENSNFETPSSWNATSNNFENDSTEHGVLDLSDETKVREILNTDILSEEAYSSLKSLGKVLTIFNKKQNVSISYSNSFTLSDEKLYKIEFIAYTNCVNGAYFTLINNSKEYSFGNTSNTSQTKKLFKNLEKKTYSFVIKTEKNMLDKTIALKLGLNSNDSTNALLMFDKFLITEISDESEFSNAANSTTSIPVTLKAKTDTASSTPKDNTGKQYKQKNNEMIFLYASAGTISALLVVVIIIFIIKKYFRKNKKQTFKKKPKNKPKNNDKSSRDMFN